MPPRQSHHINGWASQLPSESARVGGVPDCCRGIKKQGVFVGFASASGGHWWRPSNESMLSEPAENHG